MISVISEVETKVLSMDELEELSSTAARELTDRIKAATDDLYDMLWRAHQGKAWAALEYTSWKNYCETEFRMSARHSYRLLTNMAGTSPPTSKISERACGSTAQLGGYKYVHIVNNILVFCSAPNEDVHSNSGHSGAVQTRLAE
jgi:hypothetical protein